MPVPDYLKPESEDIPVTIMNDPFFPDIELDKLQNSYQIDSTHGKDRQLQKLKIAMLHCNKELAEEKQSWKAQTWDTLAEVPAMELGEDHKLVLMYEQAVFSKTMALLHEKYRATDSTDHALKKSDPIERTVDHYNNDYRHALMYLHTHSAGETEGERSHQVSMSLI